MNTIKRTFALLVRDLKKPFVIKRDFKKLYQLWAMQSDLPTCQPVHNKLLIIRLDDIGDYILWRNSLRFYKTSLKWNRYQIVLLGNKAWKSIFDYIDNSAVDKSIWVDKSEYLANETYRFEIWKQLRAEGFETVICPTKIRTPLFDDICTLATGSLNTFGTKSTCAELKMNAFSDKIYKHLYQNNKVYHEFFFNQDFANWCCQTNYHLKRPEIDLSLLRPVANDYILCYIGASRKSRRLPVKTWIQLIELVKKSYDKKIILAGGPAEQTLSQQIVLATQVDNITGKVSLAEMTTYTAFAAAVITGDTMEAHLAVSCKKPTVIFANGNTFARFSAYKEAGIQTVETVYAKPFLKAWKKKNYVLFLNYVAVTNDITTITAEDIMQALQKVYVA